MLGFPVDLADGVELTFPMRVFAQYRRFAVDGGFHDAEGYVYRTNFLRYRYAGKDSLLSEGHWHRDDNDFALTKIGSSTDAQHAGEMLAHIAEIKRRGRIPRVLYFHPTFRASRQFQLGRLQECPYLEVTRDRHVRPYDVVSFDGLKDHLLAYLHPITRVRAADLPEGRSFPDPWPQYTGLGIVHVISGAADDQVTVPPADIEIWMNGEWRPLSDYPDHALEALIHTEDVAGFVPDVADLITDENTAHGA